MNSCEFVSLVSIIACTIAKGKSQEELTLLGTFFNQLGDTLSTIAAVDNCNNK